jgi:dTMP kinase
MAHLLAGLIEDGWLRVVYTKEPTGGPVGFIIWQILKGYLPESLRRPDVLAYLFAADRVYHLYEDPTVAAGTARGVAGALASGYIVVMDRYKYSSVAYQAAPLPNGIMLDLDLLLELNQLAPPPHILVYLDVEPLEAAKRIIAERKEIHLYENAKLLSMVRDNYKRIIERLRLEPELQPSIGEKYAKRWYTYMPRAECVYRGGPWPRIIVVEEDGSLEETARRIAEAVIEEALRSELLQTRPREG